ncbi:MAG: hypothetical protein K2L34_03565 [Muribaculaceae bacterium]|nr:hypothetical protein [Muribaculaceae bacterium]
MAMTVMLMTNKITKRILSGKVTRDVLSDNFNVLFDHVSNRIATVMLCFLCGVGASVAQTSQDSLRIEQTNQQEKAQATQSTQPRAVRQKGLIAEQGPYRKKIDRQNGTPDLESHNLLREYHIFDNLEAAFTLGTTGLGLEIATPVTKWARLRVGFDGIPKFNLPMDFDVATYAGEDGESEENHFDKVKDIMLDITGEEMDESVRMNAKPNIYNFKLLVDVYPFQNDRRWHVTAGLYFGSSIIGRAINDKRETNSLVAMNLYNRIFDKMETSGGNDPLFGDIYISPATYERMMQYGKVGIHLGDFKDGTPYYMTPETNGTVSAVAYANSIKPYLGFGFASPVDKQQRLNLGFEAGMLFWGGSPDVILPDGINMTKDLKDIRGKVGTYVNFMKALKVYPAVSFRISYTIF